MAAGRASMATMMRVIITALLAPLFCLLGAVGPLWAIVCLTLPVILEVSASALLAAPYIKKLEPSNDPPPLKKELIRFNLPLSISGYFLALSAMVLGAFIARAADPERMLPAYYLALALGCGNLASTISLRLLLDRIGKHDLPVPATTTFHGQIR
jgi:hypothetical protein